VLKSTLRDNWKLIAVFITAALVFLVLYGLRNILLPFFIGIVLAYVILPIFRWIEKKLPRNIGRKRYSRMFNIILLYLLFFGALGVGAYFLIINLQPSIASIAANIATYYNKITGMGNSGTQSFLNNFPPALQTQINKYISSLGSSLLGSVNGTVSSFSIPAALGTVLGFAILPVFLFYLLKDWGKITKGISNFVPVWAKEHTLNLFKIIDRVIGRFIRAQFILAVIISILSFIGLTLLGVKFAPVLAVIDGLGRFIPTIGPIISGITIALVTLAVSPNRLIAVIALIVGVQLLENLFITPKVQSGFMRIHPVATFILLIVGSHFGGIYGFILVLPLTAFIVELYKYVTSDSKVCFMQDLNTEFHDSPLERAGESEPVDSKPAD